MEAKAIAKYVRISPLKVNYICDEIRGKQVDEALSILKFTNKKVLMSYTRYYILL